MTSSNCMVKVEKERRREKRLREEKNTESGKEENRRNVMREEE